jgi:hypothetical protein
MNRPTVVLWMSCLAFAAAPAWSAGKAHEHGALKLDVAIEGNKLTIAMEAPLDNLLGFERAPRGPFDFSVKSDGSHRQQRRGPRPVSC